MNVRQLPAIGLAILSGALLAGPRAAAAEARRTPAVAFHYGTALPVAELGQFDWVVVQPDHVDARELSALRAEGVAVFAYLSLGEAPARSVDPAWIIGRNAGWDSAILDPAAQGWRARVLSRAAELAGRGFHGLFLDTLDSYLAASPDPRRREAARDALASLVEQLHAAQPGLALFLNRGFEILDEVGPLVSALAAESLFARWDAGAGAYVDVPPEDRAWLEGRLREVRDRLGIPVVAIDYLPPPKRAAMRDVARRIADQGFVPWVANASLDALGVGAVEVVPRRVLVLYDGKAFPAVEASPAHRLAALPLEHLGLVPEYVDVRAGLPAGVLAGRYAGVVTCFTSDDLPATLGYPAWLLRQVEDGVRVAVLGRLGFVPGARALARLGLAAVEGFGAPAARLAHQDGIVGLEAAPALRARGITAVRAAGGEVEAHLSVEDARGRRVDPVVTGPWGGLALDPYLVDVGYEGRVRWIVDPFRFLERALGAAATPALDLTTESGARLLLVSAEADALGSDAAAALRARVLDPGPVATTLLLPRGSEGAGKDARCDVAPVAALPSVELADADGASTAARCALAAPRLRRVALASWPGQAGPPTLASLPPSAAPGAGPQVYLPGLGAAAARELAWRGALDRDHLAEVARLTDGARRVAPIALHYPSSLASTPGAAREVVEAIRWATAQRTLPLWLDEYAARVAGFRAATLARTLDGGFHLRGLGALRTVRLPRALGWPDLARSRGVAGVLARGDDLYVSLVGLDRVALALTPARPDRPYLAWSNATVDRWEEQGDAVVLRLRGHAPVRLDVDGSARPCLLEVGGARLEPSIEAGRQTFAVEADDTGVTALRCPRG